MFFFFRNSASRGIDYIKNGLLVGVNSILLPPRCLEAPGVKFSWGDVFVSCIPTSEEWIRDQTLPTSLRTLWEWKNRVFLEEYYIFNEATPPEGESEKNIAIHVDYYLLLVVVDYSLLLPRVLLDGLVVIIDWVPYLEKVPRGYSRTLGDTPGP